MIGICGLRTTLEPPVNVVEETVTGLTAVVRARNRTPQQSPISLKTGIRRHCHVWPCNQHVQYVVA